jgi:hypothetical protein
VFQKPRRARVMGQGVPHSTLAVRRENPDIRPLSRRGLGCKIVVRIREDLVRRRLCEEVEVAHPENG